MTGDEMRCLGLSELWLEQHPFNDHVSGPVGSWRPGIPPQF